MIAREREAEELRGMEIDGVVKGEMLRVRMLVEEKEEFKREVRELVGEN